MQASWKLFLPGMGGAFLLFLLLCFWFVEPLRLLGDGGTCRHLDTGLFILQNHFVPTVNYVSAFFPKSPWMTHSFIGDVLFGILYNMFGLNGIVFICALALCLAIMWSYQFATARGLGPVACPVFTVVLIAVTSLHWSARCHLFSYLTFLVVYYLNYMANIKAWQRALLTGIAMCLWANFHGSFLVGIAAVGIKFAADFVQNYLWNKKDSADRAVAEAGPNNASENGPGRLPVTSPMQAFACLCAALIGVLITPRGFGFYSYVVGYLSHPMILFHSDEWRPFDFILGIASWATLALYLLVVALWVVSRRVPDFAEFILVNFLFLSGLYTMRVIPYFALIALPALGPSWAYWKANLAPGGGLLRQGLHWLFRLESNMEQKSLSLKSLVLFQTTVCALMALIFLLVPSLRITDMNPLKLPVYATNYIIKNKLDGLGFCLDNWGCYLYWRKKKPIFIDDKTDFYPVDFIQTYMATLMAQPGWQNALDHYGIEYVLIPKSTLLGTALSSSKNWKLSYSDNLADLYTRVGK